MRKIIGDDFQLDVLELPRTDAGWTGSTSPSGIVEIIGWGGERTLTVFAMTMQSGTTDVLIVESDVDAPIKTYADRVPWAKANDWLNSMLQELMEKE